MRSRFAPRRLGLLICFPALLFCADTPPPLHAQISRNASGIVISLPIRAASVPGIQTIRFVLSRSAVPALAVEEKAAIRRQGSFRSGGFYKRGKRLMLAYDPPYVEFRDVRTGKRLAAIDPLPFSFEDPPQEYYISCAAITPDGKRCFLGGLAGDFWVFDVPHGRVVDDWISRVDPDFGDDDFHELTVSPDGKYLLLRKHYSVELRSTATLKLVQVLERQPENEPDPGYPFEFSPDGKYIATLGSGGEDVLVLAVPSGRQIRQFHSSGISQIFFSPDGRQMLTVNAVQKRGEPEIVRLWEWRTGKMLREFTFPLEDELGTFRTVILTPDGKQLAVGGRQISFWDIQTGREVRRFPKNPPTSSSQGFEWFTISPDDQYILNGPDLCLWRLATGELIRRLEAATTAQQGK